MPFVIEHLKTHIYVLLASSFSLSLIMLAFLLLFVSEFKYMLLNNNLLCTTFHNLIEFCSIPAGYILFDISTYKKQIQEVTNLSKPTQLKVA